MLFRKKRTAFVCVAENSDKYLAQAVRLLQSIRWFGGRLRGVDVYVCVIDEGTIASEWVSALERYNAIVHRISRYSPKSPHSNKLQAFTIDALKQYKNVVLLDCDTLLLDDITDAVSGVDFAAKIADGATAPHAMLQTVFDFFEIPIPPQNQKTTVTKEDSIPYFNSGVLMFSQSAWQEIGRFWRQYNDQLIENMHLLGERAFFCDQVSLAVAVVASSIDARVLPSQFNFPMHLIDQMNEEDIVRPHILHYHDMVDNSGFLHTVQSELVQSAVDQFNQRLRIEREERGLQNQHFWNQRYRENPELGSGVGSRGKTKEYKQGLITQVLESGNYKRFLDIGCGDMEVSEVIPANGYVGVDVSDEIIRRNQKTHPDREFVYGDFATMDIDSADVSFCLDVLIHIADVKKYRKIVQRIVEKTQHVGIVAAYEQDSKQKGIVFFHEPITKTLKRYGARDIEIMGEYNKTAFVVFRK